MTRNRKGAREGIKRAGTKGTGEGYRRDRSGSARALLTLGILLIGSMLPWMDAGEQACAAANLPVTMEIPLELTASGQAADGDKTGQDLRREVFTLTAASPGAPMPEDAMGGAKVLTLQETTKTSFGPIRYDSPGVYDYTVRASDANTPVYRVRVVAANDGQGTMIIRRDGQEGKTELVYQGRPLGTAGETETSGPGEAKTGQARSAEVLGSTPALHRDAEGGPVNAGPAGVKGPSPETGEATPILLWILLWAGSLLVLFLLLAASGVCPRNRGEASAVNAAQAMGPGGGRGEAGKQRSDLGDHSLRRKRQRQAGLCLLLLLCLLVPAAEDSFGASTKVTLHRHGTCKDCGAKRGDDKSGWTKISYDDGVGVTYFRWISYVDPATGKKRKVDTYCMEPSKSSPGVGTRTAVLLDAAKGGKQQNIARVLYFAGGGPGEETLKAYLKANRSTYPDFQTEKGRYGMMHILLSYAADPDAAFRVKDRGGSTSKAVNGELSSGFQKKIRRLYQWCQNNAVIVTDPAFAIKPSEAEARMDAEAGGYLSQQMRVTGSDSRQFFRYKVPAGAQVLLTHGGAQSFHTAGSTVSIHVGDRFQMLLDADRSSGIAKRTVTGELTRLKPYRIRSSGAQDLGFYAAQSSVTADFSVAMVQDQEERTDTPGGEGTGTDPEDPADLDDLPGDEAAGDAGGAQVTPRATHTLQVSKRLQDAGWAEGQTFAFLATLHGLSRDRYLAVKRGTASVRISADQAGDITVAVENSTWAADLRGIPVKLTRSDGASRTLLTDEGGRISSRAYTDWLRQAEEDHRFRLEFLGQVYEEVW